LAAKRLAQYAALSPLLANSACSCSDIGLQVNAGHGLTLENTRGIAQLPEIVELNIGHSIIARAVFVGLESATNEMKNLMLEAA
jgi:pyridoxine 5-phosphate synthase